MQQMLKEVTPGLTFHCTLFLSTEITVLVYVGRTLGRGNYSIMVHGEFTWLVGDQKPIVSNLKAYF